MQRSLQRGRFLGCLIAQSHVSHGRLGLRSFVISARRDDLLHGINADHRDDVARILEQTERARDSWEVVHTTFYSPPVVADAMGVLQRLADVAAVPWGGYSQAERCRISLGREEALAGAVTDPAAALDSVAALRVEGNFLFDPATHRDFLGTLNINYIYKSSRGDKYNYIIYGNTLIVCYIYINQAVSSSHAQSLPSQLISFFLPTGACLGTGIERQVVGDILVQGDTGAQILVVPSMVEHLEFSLTQVRSVPVKTRLIPLTQLRVPPPKVMELSSVEASLRLDAIGSAGFRISRSKMTDLIKGGDVRVNWKSGTKPSVDVAAGDVISCAGKGRIEVKGITQTKKGKWAVEMVRYV